jgi:hypothetical protein
VSITYDAPTAVISGTGVTGSRPTVAYEFTSTQALGTASPAENFTLTNGGSAPLVVSGAALSGTDPGDYIVNNGCGSPVMTTCTIEVRFAPQATGPSSATLTISSNAPSAITVALSGTGGSLPIGATGKSGATGPAGATKASGANGVSSASDVAGPAGPAG